MKHYDFNKETEVLEAVYPDWVKIVGAVDVAKGEMPSTKNKFRQWLEGKSADYQRRINGTRSSFVIMHAIQSFHAEVGDIQ